jgi:Transposase DDE domain/Domain of unknown function (DUF4372)
MVLILLVSKHLAMFWTREGDNTMRHQNSVFHGLLKYIPWKDFDALVDKHKSDFRVRKLSTKSHFLAMLYGQLGSAASLREMEAGLTSHSHKLYHLGAKPIARSTLADANSSRPHEVFSSLLDVMMRQADRGLHKTSRELVRLIDSTSVSLSGMASAWARFSKNTTAAKAHIIYDPDADRPLYLSVTTGKTNDITAAYDMPIDSNATYVFDKAYYSYPWWAKLHANGCRFVTRIKSNTKPALIEERTLPETGGFVADQIVILPKRQCYSRKNPFNDPVRVITMTRECGKNIEFLTNDLTAPAQEIADLYKRRWAIELFFKWVKQGLKIKHFAGRSENAVRIQIAVALIAYIIVRLARDATDAGQSILLYMRLIRANLMHNKPLNKLHKPPPVIPYTTQQLTLNIQYEY